MVSSRTVRIHDKNTYVYREEVRYNTLVGAWVYTI